MKLFSYFHKIQLDSSLLALDTDKNRLFIDIFIQIFLYRIWTRIFFNVTIYTKVTIFVYMCRYLKERKSKIFVFLSALQHKWAMPD